MTKRKSSPAKPGLTPTHKIVTKAVADERKRGHAAITKAPAKRRR